MRRLKTTEVKEYRENRLQLQQGRCVLCDLPVSSDAVLDHDHRTGVVRGVLHRGCNAMLGHIENNMARNFLTDPGKLATFCKHVVQYLAGNLGPVVPGTPVFHPSHKTEEEKRLRRNKRARVARQNKSAQGIDLAKEFFG